MIVISEQIKKMRKAKGLTQEELAQKCNVVRTTITNVETQNGEPSVLLLQRIALVLNCELMFVPDGSPYIRIADLEKEITTYKQQIGNLEMELRRLADSLILTKPEATTHA